MDREDIDDLGNLLCRLCKYAHHFSKHSTDSGHVTVDPFRVTCILKKDAQPVKQRPYRHSPVLAAKVQTEIDKLLLAGADRNNLQNNEGFSTHRMWLYVNGGADPTVSSFQ